MKNLNSFRYLQKALEHEIARQIELLADGGRVVQETRLWDPAAARTVSMRSKEEAHDYRYFPEPDLPPARVQRGARGSHRRSAARAAARAPGAFRRRVRPVRHTMRARSRVRARSPITSRRPPRRAGNPKAAKQLDHGRAQSHAERARTSRSSRPAITPEALAGLITLVDGGTINSTTAKTVFEKMYGTGRPADEIVRSEGLAQISDEDALVDDHP